MLDWWKRSFVLVGTTVEKQDEAPIGVGPVSYWNFERHYINILRRESANFIIDNDLDAFVSLFYEMARFEQHYENIDREKVREEKRRIRDTFKEKSDINMMEARHFIKYDRAAGDIDDAVFQYKIAAEILILDRICSGENKRIYNEDEIRIFNKFVTDYKNEIFKSKLKKAFYNYNLTNRAFKEIIGILRTWQRGEKKQIFPQKIARTESILTDLVKKMKNYSDEDCFVCELNQNLDESRYGVHLKKTNEYGVVAEIMKENGKVFRSFFRSDALYGKDSEIQV